MSEHSHHLNGIASITSGAPRRLLLGCCAVLALLACANPPALALPQRGHVFCDTCTFGTSGDGELSDPGALALSEVGETKGDLYVLDRGHNRIVQYGPKGEFISAWGWGVRAGATGKEYEVCGSGETCNPTGLAGWGKYQLNSKVLAIAVDNCTSGEGKACTKEEDPSVGDVYLLTETASGEEAKDLREEEAEGQQPQSEYAAIDKFEPEGKPLERITKTFTYEGGCETNAKRKPCKEELETEEAHGLTVGPHGTVWLYYSSPAADQLYPLSDRSLGEPAEREQPLKPGESERPLPFAPEGFPASGLAAGAHDDFYIAEEQQDATDVVKEWKVGRWKISEDGASERSLEETQPHEPPLDRENTVAVAVDRVHGDAYLDNQTTLAAFAPDGSLIQRLSAPATGQASGLAISASTGALYVADAAANDIDLFTAEAPAAPTIEAISAQDVSAGSAQLDATIDPRGAAEQTSWHFQYGSSPCASDPTPCTEVPGGEIGGESFGEEGFGEATVTAHLQQGTPWPLLPSTTYHYRLIAENKEHGASVSEEATFTTQPTTGQDIADARGWEMVSPPDMQGADVDPLGEQSGGAIQAAADGDAITYFADGPLPGAEGNRSVEVNQILSSRSQDGWSSKDIITPNSTGAGIAFKQQEYDLFSPDLSLSILTPVQLGGQLAQPPLAPPVTESEHGKQEKTIYLRDDQPIAPEGEPESAVYRAAAANGTEMSNPGYLALVDQADAPGAAFGGEDLKFDTATPDLSHVLIESQTPLETGAGAFGLYEWSSDGAGAGTLAQVNLLPEETPAPSAHPGVEDNSEWNLSHAISNDGSRVFFSTHDALFMRDTTNAQTVQVAQDATFQTASADGARVFFTDPQRLTVDSGASPEQPDLYACEIAVSETTGKLQGCNEANGTLSDLTPARHTGAGEESADVATGYGNAGVLGAGQDATTVYFVAAGVLSETANAQGESAQPGDCHTDSPAGATCNLYMDRYDTETHSWRPPTFIAALAAGVEGHGDGFDWQGVGGQGSMTSRVSPNGEYLAFLSERELTGYDNIDTHPQADGAHDEEVFLYNASTEHLTCASCDPSGARPAGVLDPRQSAERLPGEEEHEDLLVDLNHDLAGRWLAASLPQSPAINEYLTQDVYQGRVLSDSGRLFFDSPADLVPAATNGLEDVYEYEPPGVPHGSHQCTPASATYSQRADGCIGLISSGTSTSESVFLDASQSGGEGPDGEELSEGGGDVFFLTAAKLVPEDLEGAFAAYDAHECTAAQPCRAPGEANAGAHCETVDSCRAPTPAPLVGATPASAGVSGQGNLTPQQKVLPSETTKPKPLTRAQKLTKALSACKHRYSHNKRKRITCEAAARKSYGPVKSTRPKTGANKSDARTTRTRRGTR